jgi:hypothetical protein
MSGIVTELGTFAAQDAVPFAQVTGHVAERGTDTPIEGARVRITPVGSSVTPPGLKPQELITNSDGEFRVELPSAQYMITITKPGFTPVPRLSTFAAGERIEDLRFAMNRGGAMAGHVTDVNGQPLNNFIVMALPMTMRDGRPATARGVLARSTNDGTFILPTLPTGEYVVVARPATSTPPVDICRYLGTAAIPRAVTCRRCRFARTAPRCWSRPPMPSPPRT